MYLLKKIKLFDETLWIFHQIYDGICNLFVLVISIGKAAGRERAKAVR